MKRNPITKTRRHKLDNDLANSTSTFPLKDFYYSIKSKVKSKKIEKFGNQGHTNG